MITSARPIFLAALFVSSIGAETKAEIAALRAQHDKDQADIAKTRADILELQRKVLTNRTALSAVSANSAKAESIATQRDTSAKEATQTNAIDAAMAAKLQAEIATTAASNAAMAASTAKSQATVANSSVWATFVVQLFGFAALIMAAVMKSRKDTSDMERQDKKDAIAEGQRLMAIDISQRSALESEQRDGQTHVLLDGNLTAAMAATLEARQEMLVILESALTAQQQAGGTISLETLAVIAAAKLKVAELKNSIADRESHVEKADNLKEQAAKTTRVTLGPKLTQPSA